MEQLKNKTFWIKTYGCQMNVYDSSKISALLKQEGMEEVLQADQADAIILNTCHIREKARHKVLTELGFLRTTQKRRYQQTGIRPIIAVGGCVAQAEGKALIQDAPVVDIVFGTQMYHKLPTMLAQIWSIPASHHPTPIVEIDFPAEDKFNVLPKQPNGAGGAFLAIQEGCDKFCSYCVVPYTRGLEVSRSVESVREEARSIAESGGQEITLLGQNVNAYQGVASDGRRWGFAALLRAVSAIPGVQRIFYTSSHPVDFEDDLIHAHAELPNVMPFIHLPVQSGSNAVLKAMHRGYTIETYKSLIDRARALVPHIAFASDFIVGFPGETDEDFAQTLELVQYVQYAQAFSFQYSPRPGTAASVMPNQIPESVKMERLQCLQDLLRTQQKTFNQKCVGTVRSVMFQGQGKGVGQALGKTEYMQSVIVHNTDVESLCHTIRAVRITGATLTSLEGELVD